MGAIICISLKSLCSSSIDGFFIFGSCWSSFSLLIRYKCYSSSSYSDVTSILNSDGYSNALSESWGTQIGLFDWVLLIWFGVIKGKSFNGLNGGKNWITIGVFISSVLTCIYGNLIPLCILNFTLITPCPSDDYFYYALLKNEQQFFLGYSKLALKETVWDISIFALRFSSVKFSIPDVV